MGELGETFRLNERRIIDTINPVWKEQKLVPSKRKVLGYFGRRNKRKNIGEQ